MTALDDRIAVLQAGIAALKAARMSGLKQARFGERMMEYRSDQELQNAIADAEGELGTLLGTGGRRRIYLTSTRRGY